MSLPLGDLARVKNHEANDDWPHLIEVVAYFGGEGRKGKRRSITITAASAAINVRYVSSLKSWCPGVSSKFT